MARVIETPTGYWVEWMPGHFKFKPKDNLPVAQQD